MDEVFLTSPSSIDFGTLKSSPKLPKEFLIRIGLPESYVNYLPDFYHDEGIRLFSVFLSHLSRNKDFAGKLYDELRSRKVQVWYDERQIKPGDYIKDRIHVGVKSLWQDDSGLLQGFAKQPVGRIRN